MQRFFFLLLVGLLAACSTDGQVPPSSSSNQAPSLRILSPSNGASISGSGTRAEISVSDDKAVTRLTRQVNGGSEQDITIQPTQSGNIIFWIPLVSGSNTAVIRVYDAEGLSASATLNLQVGGSGSGGSGGSGSGGGSFGADYGGYTLPNGPTYYVGPGGSNTNDGSRERPWATISFAVQKLKPGDVLRVLPGSYNETVQVNVSGTSNQRITIASETRWGAKLNAQGNLFGIDVHGSYVDIVGFEVTNATNSGIISWAPYNRFLFNHVYGIRAQCDSNGGAGVNMSSPDSSDGVLLGNLVHDIGDLSAGSCTRIHGIYQGAPRGLVQNNITYRARGFGITTWHAATAVTISNNLSFGNQVGGISVGSGDNTRGNRAENFLVANNIVVGNPRGISEEGNTGVNRFVNNLVWNNTTNWRLLTSTQQGSLSLDPGFVNYQPDGSGNYTLQSSSPAIDKGVTERAPAIDFQARPRLQGSAPDLGPFEVR